MRRARGWRHRAGDGDARPEVVYHGTRGGLDEARILRGPRAFLNYIDEVVEPWQRFDLAAERLIDVGDAVVVFWHETGRARHAELQLERDTASVLKVRDGKVVEIRNFLEREEALDEAGRPE